MGVINFKTADGPRASNFTLIPSPLNNKNIFYLDFFNLNFRKRIMGLKRGKRIRQCYRERKLYGLVKTFLSGFTLGFLPAYCYYIPEYKRK